MKKGSRNVKKIFFSLLLSVAILNPICPTSQASQKDFHAEILKYYSFQPHTLSKKGIEKKSSELDQFWKKVQSNKELYLPLLRSELQNYSNPSFFFYDGSKLLLSMSEEQTDKMLLLKAMPRVDLRDIQLNDYLFTIHNLAREGLDTSEAALHILKYPDFKAFIVQHYLTLGQDYSFLYMLIPTQEEYYLTKLVDRLKTERDPTAQKTLLKALWYTMTDVGDKAIEEFHQDKKKPEETRKLAKELLDRNLKSETAGQSSNAIFSSLKQKRKEVMRRISDEALLEFDALTMLMLAAR